MKWLNRLRDWWHQSPDLAKVQKEKADLERKFKELYDRVVALQKKSDREREADRATQFRYQKMAESMSAKAKPTEPTDSTASEQIAELRRELKDEKDRADKFYNMFVKVNDKYVQVEEQGRAQLRQRVIADFRELGQTDAKLLWINSPDPRVVNEGTYAQIRDIMRRIAPSIEMIVLTYGSVKLFELRDEDLNKLGLARIKDHHGGAIGCTPKQVEDKRSSDD